MKSTLSYLTEDVFSVIFGYLPSGTLLDISSVLNVSQFDIIIAQKREIWNSYRIFGTQSKGIKVYPRHRCLNMNKADKIHWTKNNIELFLGYVVEHMEDMFELCIDEEARFQLCLLDIAYIPHRSGYFIYTRPLTRDMCLMYLPRYKLTDSCRRYVIPSYNQVHIVNIDHNNYPYIAK